MPGTATPRTVARGGSLAHPHLIAAVAERDQAGQLDRIARMCVRSVTTGGVR